MKRPLTEDERTTITNGLRVAAERFDEHVHTCRNPHGPDNESYTPDLRLARQFETQAKDSRALADLIDGCEAIEITPYVEAIHGR